MQARRQYPMKRVSDIDLRLLRVFVTVVEARGFAAAEAYLNVSTSTISVHISNLEKRLGLRLCERGRSGFKLTERGRIVYEETKSLLMSLDDFAGTIANVKSLVAGKLVIGISDALVSHPDFSISEVIREFNSIDNEVEIDLVIAPKQELERDVVDGRSHAAIGPFGRSWSGLRFTPLFSESHDVYCGRGHPLFGASAKVIDDADLSKFPTVVRSYLQEFDRDHLSVIRQEAMTNTIEGMLLLLLSGSYIGYLPRHYAESWVERGELARIDRAELTYESQHGLIARPSTRVSLALETFISILIH